MYLFLTPLFLGFMITSASTFTAFYSHHFGERTGKLVSIILRDVIGIPVWTIGYGMTVQATSTLLFNTIILSSTLAWLMTLVGIVVIFTGLVSIRWRAVAPSLQDTLVAHGIYAHIRHSIYSGMILELIGLFLFKPTLPVMVACALGMIWVMIQARLEEMDLVMRIPAYKDYMRRVPRFLPMLR
jgi:protein-S-isoprenylcysteine O-methyltransferase Ste14